MKCIMYSYFSSIFCLVWLSHPFTFIINESLYFRYVFYKQHIGFHLFILSDSLNVISLKVILFKIFCLSLVLYSFDVHLWSCFWLPYLQYLGISKLINKIFHTFWETLSEHFFKYCLPFFFSAS